MKKLTSIFLSFLFLFHSIVLGVDGRPHGFFSRFLAGVEDTEFNKIPGINDDLQRRRCDMLKDQCANTEEMVSSYEYAPNGNLLSFSEGIFNPFRFNTKYLDEETGLYYYGYRFYNPTTGRWLNQDPLGINGGLNLYAANGNDGINNIDPYGLSVYKTLDSFWDWGGDAINYLATGGNPSDENLMLLDKYVYSNKVVAAYADLGDGIRQVASLMDCVFPADLLKSFGMGLVKELAFVIGAAGAAALLGGPVVAVAGVALVGWAAKQFWDQREQISEYAGKIFGSDCQCWSIRERRQLSSLIGDIFAGIVAAVAGGIASAPIIQKSLTKLKGILKKAGRKAPGDPGVAGVMFKQNGSLNAERSTSTGDDIFSKELKDLKGTEGQWIRDQYAFMLKELRKNKNNIVSNNFINPKAIASFRRAPGNKTGLLEDGVSYSYDKSITGISALEEMYHWGQLINREQLTKSIAILEIEAKRFLLNNFKLSSKVSAGLEEQIFRIKNNLGYGTNR